MDRDPHCISWPPGWSLCDSQELTFLDNFRGGFEPRYLVKHRPLHAQPGAQHQSTAAGCSPPGLPCRDTKRVCDLVPAAGSGQNPPDPSPCL